MRVNPLYTDIDKDNTWRRITPIPTLCICDFTPELISSIKHLRDLLINNGLSIVSEQITAVEWFHKTTRRFHLHITTVMNVTKTTVYFSGHHAPHKSPYFQTTELPFSEIIESSQQFKRINLEEIHKPMPQGLVKKVLQKEQELHQRDELHSSLIELQDSLGKIDNSAIEIISTDVHELSGSLLKELSNQDAQIEKMQLEIDSLNKELLHRCFGVGKGDWIACDGSDYNPKRVQLQLAEVYYHNNKLWLSGPIITQQGKVGKRTETIAISIFPDEHSE